MSKESIVRWPLRPSHAASVAHGLAVALSDLLQEEGGGEIPRRAFLKACAIAAANEVLAGEVSHFFGGQLGDDETLLAEIEERFHGE